MSETLQVAIYYGMVFAYLVMFIIFAFTLRGIRRELKRVADHMEKPE